MERDEEIQDLLKFSVGLNLGISYLSGAISYDPTVNTVDADVASMIVWMDCMLMNVDRTAKNANMLIWNFIFIMVRRIGMNRRRNLLR